MNINYSFLKQFSKYSLDRIDVSYVDFYPVEFSGNEFFMWSQNNSKLLMDNKQNTTRKLNLSFVLKIPKNIANQEIIISFNDANFIYKLDNTNLTCKVVLKITLQKGINEIEFISKTDNKNISKDPRDIYFGISNLYFDFIDYKQKKVLLHAGTEKTGTTTIQSFLHNNRKNLVKQKIFYLEMLAHNNHWFLVTYCIDETKNTDMVYAHQLQTPKKRLLWKKIFLKYITQQIKSIGQDIETVIISSEHFHSNINTLEEVTHVSDFLNTFFIKQKVLFYLRRQDKVALSRYSTRLKCGEYAKEIFLDEIDENYYDYYTILKKWFEIFGKKNMIIRSYDKIVLNDGNILSDFFHLVGYKFDVEVVENKNLSFSSESIEIIKIINKYINKNQNWYENTDINSKKLINYFVKNLSYSNTLSKKLLPSKNSAKKYYTYFKHSNQILSQNLLDGEVLFDEDFSMYPDSFQNDLELSNMLDTTISLFVKFLKENCK